MHDALTSEHQRCETQLDVRMSALSDSVAELTALFRQTSQSPSNLHRRRRAEEPHFGSATRSMATPSGVQTSGTRSTPQRSPTSRLARAVSPDASR
eukprot:2629532-Rhodomonas_salina.1